MTSTNDRAADLVWERPTGLPFDQPAELGYGPNSGMRRRSYLLSTVVSTAAWIGVNVLRYAVYGYGLG